MKTSMLTTTIVVLAVLAGACPCANAQGTAFTYQGQLTDSGHPARGTYDLRFTIFDAASDGTLIAGPITNSPVGVSNGLFSTTLDFGEGVFTGGERWLEIGVRTNGVGDFVILSPRQLLTPSPYALYAPNAGTAFAATTATNVTAGGVSATQLNTPVGPAAGQILTFDGSSLAWSTPSAWASIRGFVSDGTNHVEFAQVFIPGLSVVAFVGPVTPSGRPYQLLSVPPGTNLITVRLPDGRTNSVAVTVTAGQALTNVNFHFHLFYYDADGDGYGNSLITTNAPAPPPGWVWASNDCDDSNPNIYPGATEVCDGKDNDCDGQTDEGCTDADADGFTIEEGDCDDGDATVYPGATELIDGQDNDCDGNLHPDEMDGDGDGYVAGTIDAGGWDGTASVVGGNDCDDGDPTIHPGAIEVCDGKDNDCNGEVDDNACDDGIACTIDICDPDHPGQCLHIPNDSACDDGDPCTIDVCDRLSGGCIHVPIPDCP